MTMDDGQVDEVLTLKERKAAISTMPWVARMPGDVDNGRCEVLRSDAPLKAYWTPDWTQRDALDPVNEKYRCKHKARWVFIDLKGHIRKMCWWHLWFAGLYGTMDEEARYTAWAQQWDRAHVSPELDPSEEAQ